MKGSHRQAQLRSIFWAINRNRGNRSFIPKSLRAAFYHSAFPKNPQMHVDLSKKGDWLDATWMLGQNYKGSGYYGAYPPGYLLRMFTLFPEAQHILHLFSGSLDPVALRSTHLRSMKMVFGKHTPWDEECFPIQTRFDANPKTKPDLLGSAGNIVETATKALPPEYRKFDLVLADPPYSKDDAAKYGFALPDAKAVFQQLFKLVRPGGFVCWMDTKLPMYRKAEWDHFGNLTLIRSTNNRVRLVSIFQRVKTKEGSMEYETRGEAVPWRG